MKDDGLLNFQALETYGRLLQVIVKKKIVSSRSLFSSKNIKRANTLRHRDFFLFKF